MPKGIQFDSRGRVVVTDKDLYRQIAGRLLKGKRVSLRLPALPGAGDTDPGTRSATIGLTLFRLGCVNSMCECPVRPSDRTRKMIRSARRKGR